MPKYPLWGHFNEAATHYTSRDFRYTAKGESRVYAFFMKWPDAARLHLRALAKAATSGGTIEKVELLGHDAVLEFQHAEQGLTVSLPDTPPCQHAWALRITGQKLRDFEPQESIYAVEPDAEGAAALAASNSPSSTGPTSTSQLSKETRP